MARNGRPKPTTSTRRAAAALVCGAALLGAGAAETAAPDPVKAGFVFNFAKFVTWPADSAPDDTITFCFAHGALAPDVYAELDGEPVRGARVRTRAVSGRADDLAGCHLAVLAGEAPPGTAVTRAAERTGTLLIGEAPGFARQGGHIRLMRRGGKLRFRVNLPALRRAGLQVRAGLLRLAEDVIRMGDG